MPSSEGSNDIGRISRVSGSTVEAMGLPCAGMYEVARVGEMGITGEVIRIAGEVVTIQVYEDTAGLTLGEQVRCTGHPLTVELGPGLLGRSYDGIQRPLDVLRQREGDFILRGSLVDALDRDRAFDFTPTAENGSRVVSGDTIGTVIEGQGLVHRILVPPGREGVIGHLETGQYCPADTVATLDTDDGPVDLSLMHRWPVRIQRPYKAKVAPDSPFLTGQRVLDTLFPIARGGTAIVPGGFGTGKTVVEQTLAKFADADIIVYVGCGERGNEMTEVLMDFPRLEDPRTGGILMDRTILVVNTSNMPVAAREASIYTGITMAEYYRDMGYHVALMADSTSRWAEALREISSRLEEMPGEEGYPTYMGTRLACFYERAGQVRTCGGDEDRLGSVTIVSAVSPPGGDFSEPVTQGSLRVAGALWALSGPLAQRRHYPAVDWVRSYSLFTETLAAWFSLHVSPEWGRMRQRLVSLLEKEREIQEMVQLVGEDAVPDEERVLMIGAGLLRENFLRQNAFHPEDASCSTSKQFSMLSCFLDAYDRIRERLGEELPLEIILELESIGDIARLSEHPEESFPGIAGAVLEKLEKEMDQRAGELAAQREKYTGESESGQIPD